MSYMRGNPYIYRDVDGDLKIRYDDGFVSLPMEIAEELAAMIWHELSPEEQATVLDRVVEHHAGNFSVDGVLRFKGLPTTMQMIEQALADEA